MHPLATTATMSKTIELIGLVLQRLLLTKCTLAECCITYSAAHAYIQQQAACWLASLAR